MILKIEKEGDSQTLVIVKAEVVEGKFGAQVRFTTDKGDDLYLSQATADRQLSRINLPLEQVAGKILTFSRAHNPSGNPYWNIALAGAVENGRGETSGVKLVEKLDKLSPAEAKATYEPESDGGDTALSAEAWAFLGRVKEITAWYMAEITPLYVEANVGCSPESCQAGIATIVIQLGQRNGR